MSFKSSCIPVFACVLFLSYCGFVQAEKMVETGEDEGKNFSAEEKHWAVQWINERLSLLMEDGLIKRIKCYEDDENYEIFVSSSWGFLTLEEKRDFLRDLSKAREITRHSPYLVIRREDRGELLAKVNRWGILIFDESGESFVPLADEGTE